MIYTTPKKVSFSTENQLKRAGKVFCTYLSLLVFSLSVLPAFSQVQLPNKSKKAAIFEQQARKLSAQANTGNTHMLMGQKDKISPYFIRATKGIAYSLEATFLFCY